MTYEPWSNRIGLRSNYRIKRVCLFSKVNHIYLTEGVDAHNLIDVAEIAATFRVACREDAPKGRISYFSCSNNVKDYRGPCPTRHYIRADALEQVVMLELCRLAEFLTDDEDSFIEILTKKRTVTSSKSRSILKRKSTGLLQETIRSRSDMKSYMRITPMAK